MPSITIRPITGSLVVREVGGRKPVHSITGRAKLLRASHAIQGISSEEHLLIDIELLSVAQLDSTAYDIQQVGGGVADWLSSNELSLTAYLVEDSFLLLWRLLERNEANRVTLLIDIDGNSGSSEILEYTPKESQRISSINTSIEFGSNNVA